MPIGKRNLIKLAIFVVVVVDVVVAAIAVVCCRHVHKSVHVLHEMIKAIARK